MDNYRRFYAIFKQLSSSFGRDELKETLVSSFTDGRTSHLHEMTEKEYNAMCDSLEERAGWKDQLKKSRSLCLKLMQKLGIDTSDWGRVNAFCVDPRISGRVFSRLGVEDLEALQVKLRAILRKGGLGNGKSSLQAGTPALKGVAQGSPNGGSQVDCVVVALEPRGEA